MSNFLSTFFAILAAALVIFLIVMLNDYQKTLQAHTREMNQIGADAVRQAEEQARQ